MHMWVATCVGRLISLSLASGLLKGSGFGYLLHLSHIIPPICLLALEGADTQKGTFWVDESQIFIPHYYYSYLEMSLTSFETYILSKSPSECFCQWSHSVL